MSGTEVWELQNSEKVISNREQKNYNYTQWSSLISIM